MVAGDAYRPDDIITMYNGVAVEVTNTDAEGRLVLADALAYACDKLKPTAIVDAATLTGGVVVALGSWCAGLFCNDDAAAHTARGGVGDDRRARLAPAALGASTATSCGRSTRTSGTPDRSATVIRSRARRS